ncbi:RNA transcription, translation and transport factor protein isoform X1 [Halichoerus grypus]
MFRRKLTALDYHNPAGFNCKDETEFRNFIVWLEDQKIRHYKIEDRGNLRNIHSSDWPKFFEKYLKDVNCPFKIQDRQEAIDWLLGLAVRLEYGDNAEKYKDLVPDNTKNADNAAKNAEPLINLDVNNPDFKAGVMALANLLQIQRHDDYLVMLKAIRILVQERLTQDAVAKANQTKEKEKWVHKRSKSMAKVLEICPNWELLMKMENSAPDLICPSVFILPATFKHLSAALGLPSLVKGSGPATWKREGGQVPGTVWEHRGDGWCPAWGCPWQLE